MASATSGRNIITTGTSVRNRKNNYYQTQVTTLADGGVKRETFRTDSKGNNQVKIQEVTVDKDKNITNETVLSTATTEEKRALQNPNSQLRQTIKAQSKDAGDKARAGSIDPGGDKVVDRAGGGSGNDATNEEEIGDNSQPATEAGSSASDKTRNDFPKNLIYPVDIGQSKQDIIKFNMLKYSPKDFRVLDLLQEDPYPMKT